MATILTFGCRLNAYESEAMRALAPAGVVVNTCAVTAEAERQARQAIRRAHRADPAAPITVTGCAAQIAPNAWAALPGVTRVLGNAEKLRPESWSIAFPRIAVADIAHDTTAVPAVTDFAGRARAFLQIQQGCDHRCTFCVIPQGRGRNRAVPPDTLVARARALAEAGYAEIVLTGVDIASYAAPGAPMLGALVARLLAETPVLRVRLSSIDPAAIDPALWRVFAEQPRLMPHLHLSIQAGADLILKRMRRRHTRAGALAAIARARALRPDAGIGADLIAGFPTETADLFEQTRAFIDEAALSFVHVFPYSERPGTPAARMPQVPRETRRVRAAILREAGAVATGAFLAEQIGRHVAVLAETGAGRTENFAPVRLAAPAAPGTVVPAIVTHAMADHLVAVPALRAAA